MAYLSSTGVNTGTPTYYQVKGGKLHIIPATGSDIVIGGDYYKKPTQYWFIGLNPKNNLVFEPLEQVESMPPKQYITNKNPLGIDKKTARSMILPQYADRFIRQYILDKEIWSQQ